MLRFGSYAARLSAAASGCYAARFQSSTAAASSTSASSPDASARDRSFVGGTRYFRSPRELPKFEIFDVRDNPALGSMTRVAVDRKQLLVSQHPQLGPRKMDPNDMTPQFDSDRRVALRMRHMDLGAFVAVVEQRIPSHHMVNNSYDLTFERTPTGYSLKGKITRAGSQTKEEWVIQFEQQFAVALEHFLQSALTESFGFREFQDATQNRYQGNNNKNNNYGRGGGRGNGNYNQRGGRGSGNYNGNYYNGNQGRGGQQY